MKNVVLLVTARNEMEADLWAEKLRIANIGAFLREPRHQMDVGISLWGSDPNPGLREVWVRPRDEERARRLSGL